MIEWWAHPAWVIIHGLALSYNDTIKEEWKLKMNEFSYIIICGYCSSHYNTFKTAYSKQNPDYLDNTLNAFKYTVELHNSVKQKTDKPILTLNEAIFVLSEFTSNKSVSTWISEFRTHMFNEFIPTVTFNSDEDKENLIKKVEEFFLFIKTHISDEVFRFNKTFHASI